MLLRTNSLTPTKELACGGELVLDKMNPLTVSELRTELIAVVQDLTVLSSLSEIKYVVKYQVVKNKTHGLKSIVINQLQVTRLS